MQANHKAAPGRRTPKRVTPMIHVPDVRATVDWYSDIGFTIDATYGDDGDGFSFAIVSFGSTQVMFNEGGQPSTQRRREVDLYVYTDDVDDFYQRLKDRVEIVEGPHDTFYGMREFIIRDFNRFWITFGQESAFGELMSGIRERDVELVRSALDRGGLKPEALTTALAAASGDRSSDIVAMLQKAGAMPPPEIDERALQSHVGHYKGGHGMEVDIVIKDGGLCAAPVGQPQLNLVAINETTFRPVAFDGMALVFKVEKGRTSGFTLKQNESGIYLQRVE